MRLVPRRLAVGIVRNLSTNNHALENHQPKPLHVCILGAGITGLSAAYHLSKSAVGARITVLEAATRIGGWIDSKRVDIPGPSTVVLETGPRTLRPNSKAVLELISLLKLEKDLITVTNTSPAARNRFIYIPGSADGLTVFPTPASLASFWTSPVGSQLISAVLGEFWATPNRPFAATDESVDSFLSRRFGSEIARVFASAMIHGIYAADSRKLSVRAAFPSLWEAETRGNGSVVWGFMKSLSAAQESKYDISLQLKKIMENTSVYSFKDGISTLTNALAAVLKQDKNVDLRVGDAVVSLELDGSFAVRTKAGSLVNPTHILSTLPVKQLNNALSTSKSSLNQSLASILSSHMPRSSSVYVTNLVFPPTNKPMHPAGFGYLIPRPIDGYASKENPQGVLGVIFDSASLSEQDSDKRYTKMTIISGGPYSTSTSPDVTFLLATIRGHLGASYEIPDPIYSEVTERRECIPLYEVGHLDWVENLKRSLQPFGKKLHIIGAGIYGVSVPDCVEQGRKTAQDILHVS